MSNTTINPELLGRMQSDWNRRANEDAYYYAAFGRHEQDGAEFFSTAREVVHALEYELQRLPSKGGWRSRRALEIGCGPGRLLKPMSRHFGEIHGIDVSDEMACRARENLKGVPHAHVHAADGASLAAFASESFDLVYSYAVFQHIPSAEVVYSYLLEARRVLKPGGILWFQANGQSDPLAQPDTWSGARFTAQQIATFASEHDFQIYAIEGVSTQYMWTSWRKRPEGWFQALPHWTISSRTAASPTRHSRARIARITNRYGVEPCVPAEGRLAAAALWVDNLPPECGLNHLEIRIEGVPGTPDYIGAPLQNGQSQINILLPPGVRTGLVPVEANWLGRPLCPPAVMRVTPPGPRVPRVISVTDATDLLSMSCVYTGTARVTVEELLPNEEIEFQLDGQPLPDFQTVCADPQAPRLEFFVNLKSALPGPHRLQTLLRRRAAPPIAIQVTEPPNWKPPH